MPKKGARKIRTNSDKSRGRFSSGVAADAWASKRLLEDDSIQKLYLEKNRGVARREIVWRNEKARGKRHGRNDEKDCP